MLSSVKEEPQFHELFENIFGEFLSEILLKYYKLQVIQPYFTAQVKYDYSSIKYD